MTTTNDNYPDRILRFGQGQTETEGTAVSPFADPSGQFPRTEYQGRSSLNAASLDGGSHQLKIGGSIPNVDMSNITRPTPTTYGNADIRETASGHVIELNDTPGGERILFKHNSGSGIEIKPDGSVVVSSTKNKVEVVNGSNVVIVEGDAHLEYKGNLTMNVQGNFEVNCHNYTVNSRANKTETVAGDVTQSVHGNLTTTVAGNQAMTTVGAKTETILGNSTIATKGNLDMATQGDAQFVSGGSLTQTATKEINTTSEDINIAATNLSVFGSEGTIGGEEITFYSQNIFGKSATFTDGVTAPTFHGDLDGTADVAATSLHQSYSDGSGPQYSPSVGSRGSITDTATDDTATAKPTADLLKAYIEQSARGVRTVTIDEGDYISNSLRQREFTTADLRSKMKDPAVRQDIDFLSDQVARGVLNAEWSNPLPGAFERVRGVGGTALRRGRTFIGNLSEFGRVQTFKITNLKNQIDIPPPREVVDALNDKAIELTTNLVLGRGINLSKFMGSVDTGDFDNLSRATKENLIRNYTVHANVLAGAQDRFENMRISVAEGFHEKELYGIGTNRGLEPQVLTMDEALANRNTGRTVVYEVYNSLGEIDFDATFDLANYWADTGMYDKIQLMYDNYNPDGSINVQLAVTMPEVKSNAEFHALRFKQEVQTTFNNTVQATQALIFIANAYRKNPDAVTNTVKLFL